MSIFDKGILGINARNLLYISQYNREKNIKLADDKLKTKAFLSAREIPVPKLLAAVKSYKQLEKFDFSKLGNEFVLKPNLGFGGQGIIPITKKINDTYRSAKGRIYSKEQLRNHMVDILRGNFSINTNPDAAFFEKLIITDDIIGKFATEGLPDIRVIVHNLVPVMAMLRIPTMESGGKANLHLGAIGAGIDLAKGQITHLVHKNNVIKEVPGKGGLKGLTIPYFDDILRIACKAQLVSNLGFIGADIALDKHQGPLLLEINARPGIGIQTANMAPLRKRLEKLEGLDNKSIEKGVRIGKDMFGYSIEKNVKTMTGKKVIGLYENINIIIGDETISVPAFINTSRKKSFISADLAKNLGLIKSKKSKDLDNQKFKLKFKIGGKKITTIFKIDRSIKKKYQVVLGNRDLSGHFIIDPSINNLLTEKISGQTKKIFITSFDPLTSDREICKVISQLKFLSYFRPLNFTEEADKFLKNKTYNPIFKYKEAEDDIQYFKKALSKIKYDNSDFGRLLKEKIVEINNLLELITLRGSNDFSSISNSIFGCPEGDVLLASISNDKTEKRPKDKKNKINSEELKLLFEQKLIEYGIYDWKVTLKNNLLTKCVVNKNKNILIKKNQVFQNARVEELIVHELDTHLLTSVNGSMQKYRLFNYGFANYLETQEGLAIYNVLKVIDHHSEENYTNLITQAIFHAQNMSLSELFNYLKKQNLTDKSALNICFRVKRGFTDTSKHGAFTKDYLYYKGFNKIKNFIADGGSIIDLYHGKYNLDDLKWIKNISSFITPPNLPPWLK